jgi:predicted DNA binding CopG/RHH family protein
MKSKATDRGLLRTVERGEWRSTGGGDSERSRYRRYAKATLRRDRRLTISLSKRDLEFIKKRALAEGVSAETLVWSVLRKYASGQLREIFGATGGRRGSLREEGTASALLKAADGAREVTEAIAPRLLNLRQAGRYLGCSFWTIRDYVLQGLIPVVHLPPLSARKGDRRRETLRRVVIDRADLDVFIESCKGRPPTRPVTD